MCVYAYAHHFPLSSRQNMFKDGAVVLLKSRAGGKNLRIMNDEVQGTGGDGKFGKDELNSGREGEHVALFTLQGGER